MAQQEHLSTNITSARKDEPRATLTSGAQIRNGGTSARDKKGGGKGPPQPEKEDGVTNVYPKLDSKVWMCACMCLCVCMRAVCARDKRVRKDLLSRREGGWCD
jgi:hypothetical protein